MSARWIMTFVLSCTSSEPAPATCALVADACVSSSGVCCAQSGTLYDETRGCMTTTRSTIGCAPSPISEGSACVDLGIVGCAITNDGMRRVWRTGSRAIGWSPPETCSEALAAKVGGAAPCP